VAGVEAVVRAAAGFLAVRAEQGGTAWRVSELAGGVANITAALGLPRGPAAVSAGEPARTPVGTIAQADGRAAVSVVAPLARLTANLAELLASAAPEVRVTPWRGVVVPNLSVPDAGRWTSRFAAAGLVTDPASPWVGVTACAGRPGCAKSLADVRPVAADRPVHWVGCGRRCGAPAGPHVEVVAVGDAYEVRRDGVLRARSADLDEIATAVEGT
jgi:precorrin-3B synthase